MVSGLYVGERVGSAFPADVASPSKVIELSSCSPRLGWKVKLRWLFGLKICGETHLVVDRAGKNPLQWPIHH